MKALKVILIVSIVLFAATSAMAASLSHTPGSVSVTVPAGSSTTVPVTVTLSTAERGTYYLWFVSSVTGTVPSSWIRSSRNTAFLSRSSNFASTDISITVPAGTASGTYSSVISSNAMGAHGYADAGPGVRVDVRVASSCSGVPEIVITGMSPEVIWPPNHSMAVVNVDGFVKVPSGCSINETGFSIEDEYGTYTRVGKFTADGDGAFSIPLPVEAWRTGQDKDGRHYTITLFAEDDAGIGTSEVLNAVVPHDQGTRGNSK